MVVQPGAVLGRYKVESLIGRGGMGEVYRARDTTLGRDVAIKALPGALATDPERLSRFEREAHLLASLNHPHIAVLYGLERVDGVPFLAMELVPGESLAERLSRGPIPVEEALSLFRQITEALEAAHERGMVHRDLKPANVMVTPEGKVKVLDFGLAKALDEDPREGGISESPTNTYGATRAGVVLGTASYMSPEQARGKKVDARTDIWALGAVMYESLTGRKAFPGETVTDVLAAILKNEPDWEALPKGTPFPLRTLLKRCLQKDPARRLHHAADVRIEIEEATMSPEPAVAPAGKRSLAPWIFGAVMALGVGVTLWALWRPAPEPATPVRLSVELGADASLAADVGPAAILSPDGKLLAFSARKAAGERPQLYTRRLEQLAASPLAGTEDARDPFFSPDGQWIAFFADGKLKKVAVTGGAAVTLSVASEARGGTWSEDGTILFTDSGGPGVGLSRVSSAGGAAEVLTTPDQAAGERSHSWPQALPGGKAVLFTAVSRGAIYDDASIMVQSLPRGPKKVVQRGGYHGRYLPSGHLVYMHGGTLFAVPFDLGRLEPTGPPAPVLEGVIGNVGGTGGAQFAFSERGTLVFLPGQGLGNEVPIQWMDENGKTEPLRTLAGNYSSIRFSPDGQRLAMGLGEGSEQDVWVYEWGRDRMSRLTLAPGADASPVWTPDGRWIAFSSMRADKATANLYWQRADGTGEAERLTESNNPQGPASWHPSGKFVAFHETTPANRDIWILPMEGDEASGWKPGKPAAFLISPFFETDAAFSPDGRWLAYSSEEPGRLEVYVRPFPGPGGQWQVSEGGGRFPTWSRNRKELFYRTPESTLMVASYAAEGDSFRAEKPRKWSPGLAPPLAPFNRTFDLHPDGQRFAVLKAAEQAEDKSDHVVFIQNFFEELRRVAPAGKR